MALAQSPNTETISGRVEAVNERGVNVGGAWYNVSRYHAVALPLRGQPVALTVSGSWIEALTVQEAPSATESPAQPASARERTITRLAVLKAAATFASSRPDAKSCDVPKVAETWLRWVLAEEAEPVS
jgi:hypothetical protein